MKKPPPLNICAKVYYANRFLYFCDSDSSKSADQTIFIGETPLKLRAAYCAFCFAIFEKIASIEKFRKVDSLVLLTRKPKTKMHIAVDIVRGGTIVGGDYVQTGAAQWELLSLLKAKGYKRIYIKFVQS